MAPMLYYLLTLLGLATLATAKVSLADLDLNEDMVKDSTVTFSDLLRIGNKGRLDEFNSMELPLLVGYFSENSPAAKRLERLATKLRDDAIVILATETLPEELGLAEDDMVFIPRQRNSRIQYEGALSEVAIRDFLQQQKPIIDEIRPSNFQYYMNLGVPLVWLMLDPTSNTHTKVLNEVQVAAQALKEKYSVAWLDTASWGEMAAEYGLPVTDLPRLAIETLPADDKFKAGGIKYWAEPGQITESKFKQFVADYEAGKLKVSHTPPLKTGHDEL